MMVEGADQREFLSISYDMVWYDIKEMIFLKRILLKWKY